MTITQSITALPDAPDPAADSADEFSDKAAASVLAQKNMVPELNAFIGQANATALEVNNNAGTAAAAAAAAAAAQALAAASAASAIAAPGTNATSTTPLAVGSGTVSLTVQTGKSFVPGMWGNLVRTSDRSKWMLGYIDSYNSGTGALVLIVAAADANGTGSGPFTDWTFSLGAARIGTLAPVDLSLVGPSSLPSLLADFANAKRLPAGFVYTMTSPQPHYDAMGVMRYAPPGVPAFDHDPVTKECLGIQMFESRTNLVIRSEEFDNPAWTKANSTISANSRIAPDGSTTMDSLVASAGTSTHQIYQLIATANGSTAYSATVFAAAGSVSWVWLGFTTGTSLGAYFNLSTGAVGTVSGGVTASIENVGGGVYRCRITATPSNGAAVYVEIEPHTADNQGGWAAAGTENIYIWGADGGAGAFPTPYIPTTSATVTRTAPQLYINTDSSWFNATEGTLYGAIVSPPSVGSQNKMAAAFYGGVAGNYVYVGQRTGGGSIAEIVTSSTLQIIVQDSVTSKSLTTALAYKTNDSAASLNGAASVGDTSVVLPSVNTLYVGSLAASNIANGYISKVAYWPRRLPNAELTALTTQ